MNSITQWLIGIHKRLSFLVCGKIFKRGEIDLSKERITFSASNKAIHTFFQNQKVVLPALVYNELLSFLSKACTYEEEEHRVRPSLIIGNNLLDDQVTRITQATVIPLVKELSEETHLMKRLKSMLPFCNNGWRVFLSLDDGMLTYGIMRNFNGPSGLSIDDILINMSSSDKESLGIMQFGDDFVAEMLDRPYGDIDSISEYEVISLSADLGFINKTAKMEFLQYSETIQHYMSDTDPDEEYPSTKLVDMVRSCIKHVLGCDIVEYEVPFVTFRDRLKAEVVNTTHPMYSQLMSSPYFYKKTITKTLLNLAKTLQDSAERENVFANIGYIISGVWSSLSSDDRWAVGRSYAQANMISDALAGRIDLIVTKSVSRFARNTVDSLTTVRKLKDKGVEVYFEKENIYTLDSKGELLITIMSSLAQEESRSISENVTWGKRKQFADGKVCLPYGRFLGYEKGEDGLPKIVPEQAKVVTYIYDLFMTGLTPNLICKRLMEEGILSPSGKPKWAPSTVRSILTNEKYMGDALLQKEFTVDFLQKKKKINEGEVPQYYVEDSHPAIISKELFMRVQAEIKRRQKYGHSYNGKSIFSTRIVCGDCGAFFGSKVWNSNDRFRRVIWQCNNKYKGEKCDTPHITEEQLKKAFVAAFNQLIQSKNLVEDCELMLTMLTDTTELDRRLEELRSEQEVVVGLTRKWVDEHASAATSAPDYEERYNALAQRYEELVAQILELEEQLQQRKDRADTLRVYLRNIEAAEELQEFDPRIWLEIVEKATIYHDKRIVFTFQDGKEVASYFSEAA